MQQYDVIIFYGAAVTQASQCLLWIVRGINSGNSRIKTARSPKRSQRCLLLQLHFHEKCSQRHILLQLRLSKKATCKCKISVSMTVAIQLYIEKASEPFSHLKVLFKFRCFRYAFLIEIFRYSGLAQLCGSFCASLSLRTAVENVPLAWRGHSCSLWDTKAAAADGRSRCLAVAVTGVAVRSMHKGGRLDWRRQRSCSVSRPSEAPWQSSSMGSRYNRWVRRQVCVCVFTVVMGWLSKPKTATLINNGCSENVQTFFVWPLLPLLPISLPSD